MNDPIVRIIHDFAVAERLRADLLSAGFAAEEVILSPVGDEAGPGQSNFTVGDAPYAKGGTDYNDVYRPEADHHGACILKVVAADAPRQDQALAIIDRHHAAAPHAMSTQGKP